MANPYVAEIRIFPFNFAPKGWAFCDGQLLPISQNTALFSLLGTTYGGDGKSNFALPNLQGSAPLHVGGSQPGPGLSVYDLGEQSGSETVTLLASELVSHSHPITAAVNAALIKLPASTVSLARSKNANVYQDTPGNLTSLNQNTIGSTGGDQPHNNLMPYLMLNFCIAMQGVFPPRV